MDHPVPLSATLDSEGGDCIKSDSVMWDMEEGLLLGDDWMASWVTSPPPPTMDVKAPDHDLDDIPLFGEETFLGCFSEGMGGVGADMGSVGTAMGGVGTAMGGVGGEGLGHTSWSQPLAWIENSCTRPSNNQPHYSGNTAEGQTLNLTLTGEGHVRSHAPEAHVRLPERRDDSSSCCTIPPTPDSVMTLTVHIDHPHTPHATPVTVLVPTALHESYEMERIAQHHHPPSSQCLFPDLLSSSLSATPPSSSERCSQVVTSSFHNQSEIATSQFHGQSEITAGQFHGQSEITAGQFHGQSEITAGQFHGQSEITTSQFHGQSEITADQFHGQSEITAGQFHAQSEVSAGQFHAQSEVSAGQFHGQSEITAGQFHGQSEITAGQFHGQSEVSASHLDAQRLLDQLCGCDSQTDQGMDVVTSLEAEWTEANLAKGALAVLENCVACPEMEAAQLTETGHAEEVGVGMVKVPSKDRPTQFQEKPSGCLILDDLDFLADLDNVELGSLEKTGCVCCDQSECVGCVFGQSEKSGSVYNQSEKAGYVCDQSEKTDISDYVCDQSKKSSYVCGQSDKTGYTCDQSDALAFSSRIIADHVETSPPGKERVEEHLESDQSVLHARKTIVNTSSESCIPSHHLSQGKTDLICSSNICSVPGKEQFISLAPAVLIPDDGGVDAGLAPCPQNACLSSLLTALPGQYSISDSSYEKLSTGVCLSHSCETVSNGHFIFNMASDHQGGGDIVAIPVPEQVSDLNGDQCVFQTVSSHSVNQQVGMNCALELVQDSFLHQTGSSGVTLPADPMNQGVESFGPQTSHTHFLREDGIAQREITICIQTPTETHPPLTCGSVANVLSTCTESCSPCRDNAHGARPCTDSALLNFMLSSEVSVLPHGETCPDSRTVSCAENSVDGSLTESTAENTDNSLMPEQVDGPFKTPVESSRKRKVMKRKAKNPTESQIAGLFPPRLGPSGPREGEALQTPLNLHQFRQKVFLYPFDKENSHQTREPKTADKITNIAVLIESETQSRNVWEKIKRMHASQAVGKLKTRQGEFYCPPDYLRKKTVRQMLLETRRQKRAERKLSNQTTRESFLEEEDEESVGNLSYSILRTKNPWRVTGKETREKRKAEDIVNHDEPPYQKTKLCRRAGTAENITGDTELALLPESCHSENSGLRMLQNKDVELVEVSDTSTDDDLILVEEALMVGGIPETKELEGFEPSESSLLNDSAGNRVDRVESADGNSPRGKESTHGSSCQGNTPDRRESAEDDCYYGSIPEVADGVNCLGSSPEKGKSAVESGGSRNTAEETESAKNHHSSSTYGRETAGGSESHGTVALGARSADKCHHHENKPGDAGDAHSPRGAKRIGDGDCHENCQKGTKHAGHRPSYGNNVDDTVTASGSGGPVKTSVGTEDADVSLCDGDASEEADSLDGRYGEKGSEKEGSMEDNFGEENTLQGMERQEDASPSKKKQCLASSPCQSRTSKGFDNANNENFSSIRKDWSGRDGSDTIDETAEENPSRHSCCSENDISGTEQFRVGLKRAELNRNSAARDQVVVGKAAENSLPRKSDHDWSLQTVHDEDTTIIYQSDSVKGNSCELEQTDGEENERCSAETVPPGHEVRQGDVKSLPVVEKDGKFISCDAIYNGEIEALYRTPFMLVVHQPVNPSTTVCGKHQENGAQESDAQEKGAQENGTQENGTQENGTQNSTQEGGNQENGTQENGTRENGTQESDAQEIGTLENGSQENSTQENGTQENGTQENGTQNSTQENSNSDEQSQNRMSVFTVDKSHFEEGINRESLHLFEDSVIKSEKCDSFFSETASAVAPENLWITGGSQHTAIDHETSQSMEVLQVSDLSGTACLALLPDGTWAVLEREFVNAVESMQHPTEPLLCHEQGWSLSDQQKCAGVGRITDLQQNAGVGKMCSVQQSAGVGLLTPPELLSKNCFMFGSPSSMDQLTPTLPFVKVENLNPFDNDQIIFPGDVQQSTSQSFEDGLQTAVSTEAPSCGELHTSQAFPLLETSPENSSQSFTPPTKSLKMEETQGEVFSMHTEGLDTLVRQMEGFVDPSSQMWPADSSAEFGHCPVWEPEPSSVTCPLRAEDSGQQTQSGPGPDTHSVDSDSSFEALLHILGQHADLCGVSQAQQIPPSLSRPLCGTVHAHNPCPSGKQGTDTHGQQSSFNTVSAATDSPSVCKQFCCKTMCTAETPDSQQLCYSTGPTSSSSTEATGGHCFSTVPASSETLRDSQQSCCQTVHNSASDHSVCFPTREHGTVSVTSPAHLDQFAPHDWGDRFKTRAAECVNQSCFPVVTVSGGGNDTRQDLSGLFSVDTKNAGVGGQHFFTGHDFSQPMDVKELDLLLLGHPDSIIALNASEAKAGLLETSTDCLVETHRETATFSSKDPPHLMPGADVGRCCGNSNPPSYVNSISVQGGDPLTTLPVVTAGVISPHCLRELLQPTSSGLAAAAAGWTTPVPFSTLSVDRSAPSASSCHLGKTVLTSSLPDVPLCAVTAANTVSPPSSAVATSETFLDGSARNKASGFFNPSLVLPHHYSSAVNVEFPHALVNEENLSLTISDSALREVPGETADDATASSFQNRWDCAWLGRSVDGRSVCPVGTASAIQKDEPSVESLPSWSSQISCGAEAMEFSTINMSAISADAFLEDHCRASGLKHTQKPKSERSSEQVRSRSEEKCAGSSGESCLSVHLECSVSSQLPSEHGRSESSEPECICAKGESKLSELVMSVKHDQSQPSGVVVPNTSGKSESSELVLSNTSDSPEVVLSSKTDKAKPLNLVLSDTDNKSTPSLESVFQNTNDTSRFLEPEFPNSDEASECLELELHNTKETEKSSQLEPTNTSDKPRSSGLEFPGTNVQSDSSELSLTSQPSFPNTNDKSESSELVMPNTSFSEAALSNTKDKSKSKKKSDSPGNALPKRKQKSKLLQRTLPKREMKSKCPAHTLTEGKSLHYSSPSKTEDSGISQHTLTDPSGDLPNSRAESSKSPSPFASKSQQKLLPKPDKSRSESSKQTLLKPKQNRTQSRQQSLSKSKLKKSRNVKDTADVAAAVVGTVRNSESATSEGSVLVSHFQSSSQDVTQGVSCVVSSSRLSMRRSSRSSASLAGCKHHSTTRKAGLSPLKLPSSLPPLVMSSDHPLPLTLSSTSLTMMTKTYPLKYAVTPVTGNRYHPCPCHPLSVDVGGSGGGGPPCIPFSPSFLTCPTMTSMPSVAACPSDLPQNPCRLREGVYEYSPRAADIHAVQSLYSKSCGRPPDHVYKDCSARFFIHMVCIGDFTCSVDDQKYGKNSRICFSFMKRLILYKLELVPPVSQKSSQEVVTTEIDMQSIVGLWGADNKLLLELSEPPHMYLGKKWCRKTRQPIDITGGQIRKVPYHFMTFQSGCVRTLKRHLCEHPFFCHLLVRPVTVDLRKTFPSSHTGDGEDGDGSSSPSSNAGPNMPCRENVEEAGNDNQVCEQPPPSVAAV